MRQVFGHTLGSTAENSATERARYFRLFDGAFIEAEDGTSPHALQDLIYELRVPFNGLYRLKPRLRGPGTQRQHAELDEWEAAVAKGAQMCTHAYVLQCFHKALKGGDTWPKNDEASDHLGDTIRRLAQARQSYTGLSAASSFPSTNGSRKRKHGETPSYASSGSHQSFVGSGREASDGAGSLDDSIESSQRNPKRIK